ncbi:hypothetical protein RFH42_15450 [Acinetobacter rudis]|uniref:hypothetical protein n=1 Tax=Acinetobacter rudis TaxID=632955 RepID=UPI00280DE0AB|nr:hypothetical protein [Acinetobacter rudis]MDQ8954344.1 hypothetical protein [Acinetobacter rudis]
MAEDTRLIVSRIGETDQLFLQENTPELALERANLRLQLVHASHSRAEQIHFLQEAIVLLEQARVEFEQMPLTLYLDLSIQLAKTYLKYFEISQEQRFALITQQILKPLTVYENAEIYFLLAYASIAKNEPAMTRHWLNKYAKSIHFDPILIKQHPAFQDLQQHNWFNILIKTHLN